MFSLIFVRISSDIFVLLSILFGLSSKFVSDFLLRSKSKCGKSVFRRDVLGLIIVLKNCGGVSCEIGGGVTLFNIKSSRALINSAVKSENFWSQSSTCFFSSAMFVSCSLSFFACSCNFRSCSLIILDFSFMMLFCRLNCKINIRDHLPKHNINKKN